jgi:hypothetical protein
LNLPRRCHFYRAYDLWQHLAQPDASVQHLAQVAGSLQQLPSQPVVDLVLEPLLQVVEQPVAIRVPMAQASANIIIFIFLPFVIRGFIFSITDSIHGYYRQMTLYFINAATRKSAASCLLFPVKPHEPAA